MFDLRARQDLNRGFSDSLTRGIELALTPLAFALIGWLIDRVAGTGPVFAIAFFAFGVIGTSVKIKLGYDRQMAAHDGSAVTAARQVAPYLDPRNGSR
ncbi:MAG: AtpZ/AtpI family protein [Iamia sp.]